MRVMTTYEYIALTRATDKVHFHMGMKATNVAIGAQDIPGVLNYVTNGAFKFYWSSFILSRVHIAFEKLDDNGKFTEMWAMMASNEELANFLRWHMTMTKEAWTWNLPETP